MKVVRMVLWPAALAAGGATAALILTGGLAETPGVTATLALVIGLGWCLTGLEEWRRRPGNRIGPLMVLLGFSWFASLLEYANYAPLFTIGLFLPALYTSPSSHTCCSPSRPGVSAAASIGRS